MPISRRGFIKELALASFLPRLSSTPGGNGSGTEFFSEPFDRIAERPMIKPPRLKAGDTVGLINPAGATYSKTDIQILEESLAALGLGVKLGEHILDRYGYLAGKDEDRAQDVNAMFCDSSVNAIVAVRGGWGSNRILSLLDYEMIQKHPKALIGYSDITSLLVAIYARCGLVTFHGPVGISTWNQFSVEYFRRILFDAEAVTLQNPTDRGDNLAQTTDRVETITAGRTRGKLVGGNLSVLTAMVGSQYLPNWEKVILFLEETDEQIYRVDRMLSQLRLSGVLEKVAGVVFGKCTNCTPGEGYGSLTLEEVLRDHLQRLGVPSWYGSMIGHVEKKFTVSLGVEAEIDAEVGTIRMLESAVV